jgi:hypothetical protein
MTLIVMRGSYVEPGGVVDENPLEPPSGTFEAHRALRSESMGFLYLRTTGFLYMIITALLFAAIGLLSFASAH